MTALAKALKAEIRRHARSEIREALAPLKRSISKLRSDLLSTKQQVRVLERQTSRTKASRPQDAGDQSAEPARFSPKWLASHRARTGLSAEAYGALIGVTGQSIYNWEGGLRPSDDNIRAIAALRRTGLREIRRRCAELEEST